MFPPFFLALFPARSRRYARARQARVRVVGGASGDEHNANSQYTRKPTKKPRLTRAWERAPQAEKEHVPAPWLLTATPRASSTTHRTPTRDRTTRSFLLPPAPATGSTPPPPAPATERTLLPPTAATAHTARAPAAPSHRARGRRRRVHRAATTAARSCEQSPAEMTTPGWGRDRRRGTRASSSGSGVQPPPAEHNRQNIERHLSLLPRRSRRARARARRRGSAGDVTMGCCHGDKNGGVMVASCASGTARMRLSSGVVTVGPSRGVSWGAAV
jgi:hypothetical protein